MAEKRNALRLRKRSRAQGPTGLKLLEQFQEQGESPEKIITRRVLPSLKSTKT